MGLNHVKRGRSQIGIGPGAAELQLSLGVDHRDPFVPCRTGAMCHMYLMASDISCGERNGEQG